MKRLTVAKHVFLYFILTFGLLNSHAQIHVSGFIRDHKSGEVLIGANIYNINSLKGTASDNNGYFSLYSSVNDTLALSYVGYQTKHIPLSSTCDTVLHLVLAKGSELNEVVIKSRRKKQFNLSTLSNDQLKYIPSIGAEPDILKALQLMPGIQPQGEGSSNLLVRGGGPGENLFLIDNSPVYYVNHLGGFLSVFNPELINGVSVLKGGFPAKYGGKLSSVIDITMKEGSREKLQGTGGIGIFGAHLTLEGPLNDKLSYVFSGRKTFTEILTGIPTYMDGNDHILTYGFYDLTSKISWHPNDNNSVHATFFSGNDAWNILLLENDESTGLKNKWGNVLASVKWKSILEGGSIVNTTAYYSRYRLSDKTTIKYQSETDTLDLQWNFRSSVEEFSLKSNMRKRLNSFWALDYGLQSSLLRFVPNYAWEEEKVREDIERYTALESSLYLENQIEVISGLDLNLGIRLVDYLSGSTNQIHLEPRASLNYFKNEYLHFNASYMKVSQYADMLASSGFLVNNALWIPIEEGNMPASSEQYTLGWKGEFMDKMFSAEMNIYYKSFENLSTFKYGYSNLHGDALWRSKIETGGEGKSKGIEFFVGKDKGKYTGFLSYGYSHTTREFEGINNGEEFLYTYDRPHSISIDINRRLNERFLFNVVWVYQSGAPYTPVIGRSYVPNDSYSGTNYDKEALIYGKYNSERMGAYHRLDVGLQFTSKTLKGRDETWTVSFTTCTIGKIRMSTIMLVVRN